VSVLFEKLSDKDLPLKLRRLKELVEDILEDKELDDWLWNHTATINYYYHIIDTLKAITKWQFVKW